MPDSKSRRWFSLSPRTLLIAGLAALAIIPLVLPCWLVVNAASLVLVLLQVAALALALNNKVRHRALFAGFFIGSGAHLFLSADLVTREYVPTRRWFEELFVAAYGMLPWWFNALDGTMFPFYFDDFVNAGQLAVSLLCGSGLALLMQGIASRFAKAAAGTAATDATRRWHQFSLQTLLLYTVAASLGLAFVARERQRAAREKAAASQLAAKKDSLMGAADMHGLLDAWAGPYDWFWRPLLGYTSEDSPVAVLWLQNASPERLQLVGQLSSLQTLSLDFTDEAHGLSSLQNLRVLHRLGLSARAMPAESLADVGKIASLRELSIDASLPDAGLRHLAGLHQLRELDVVQMRGSNDDVPIDLSQLPVLPNLASLGLHYVADEQFKLLARQPRLESLSLWWSGSGLRNLKQCEHLRRLEIHALTKMDLDGLHELTQLERLEVHVMYSGHGLDFDDEAFEHVLQLPNLQWLSLQRTVVTDAGLAKLGRLSKLRYLSLKENVDRKGHPLGPPLTEDDSFDDEDPVTYPADAAQPPNEGEQDMPPPVHVGTYITDASAPLIGQLTELEELGLEGTGITDAGLRQLLPLKRLKVLDLNRTPLTDEGLKLLLQFPNLEHVNVEMTKVTPAGVQSLQAQRPKLYITTGSNPNSWSTILSGIRN